MSDTSYESCIDTSLFSNDACDEEISSIFNNDNIIFCPNLASSPIPSDRSLSTSLSQKTVISQLAYDCFPFLQHDISAGCDITSQVSNNSTCHLADFESDSSMITAIVMIINFMIKAQMSMRTVKILTIVPTLFIVAPLDMK